MGRQVAMLYVVAMAAVIVGVDFVFFRNRFWERFTVNIGIVLVFAAFYLWWTPFFGQKKTPSLDRTAALKMKESQCQKFARVTQPA